MARKPKVFTISERLAIKLMRILSRMPEVQRNPEITFEELMENPEVHEKLHEATER